MASDRICEHCWIKPLALQLDLDPEASLPISLLGGNLFPVPLAIVALVGFFLLDLLWV